MISHDVTLVLGQGLRANGLSPTEKMEGISGVFNKQDSEGSI